MKEFFEHYWYCFIIAAIMEGLRVEPDWSVGMCFCTFIYYLSCAILGAKIAEYFMEEK
jgi:hypothetical protein